MTLVSVIVPTYNRRDLLMDGCLPSILGQTHAELDVHVVGDGTNQATVEAMAAVTDPRVRFTNLPHQVYPEDLGQKWCVLGLEALNYGLDTARGEWIAALADDDTWEYDAIASLLAAAQREKVDFAYGKSQTPLGQMYGHWPPGAMNFTDGSYVYRASLGFRYDRACIERGLPEDADMWLRMIAAGVTFTFVDQIVMHYNRSDQR